ncbi:hypothetical protein [Citrobacter farmeri]|uniref:hypothetical protein n=1 Tax=Citrobacter farmeri TaxID=67824 RepID=UPI0029302B35|nr:hypothetical protein [Citrobacter farmeri]
MTTNHPANGPVSLDRLHQISEILSKAAAQSDGGNLGYAMADAVKVIDELLAGRKAEPVGTFRKGPCGYYASFHEDAVPLYTAPPATVVLDEYRHLSELYHAQEKRLFKLAQRIKGPSFDKYAYSPSQAIDVLEAVIFGEYADSCRAAMLQAGNSPVTPDYICPCCGRKPLKHSKCSVPGCGRKHVARGLCQRHYDMKRREDPEQVEKFREANRRFTARKRANKAAPQQGVK